MNRNINKVAILGSGVMGSRIACHFANIGVQVLLLDIIPKELSADESKKGLTIESKAVRNRIVNDSLQTAIKSNPSPIYRKSFSSRISTGNFTDNMKDIAQCDWVIEVVVENLDIKKKIFEQVEQHRTNGTIISSNTSGIPIAQMLAGRSEDFRKHFLGTHFFNPPRYLRLLELIPTPETSPDVIDFVSHYGDLHLGKTTVVCKDTPAFIANRIGVYSIMALFHLVEKMELSVEDVDKLTGSVIGRPKSATFRTCDVVGLDTLVHVAKGVYDNCPNDSQRDVFILPAYINKMVENKWLGDKTKQGFYKKTKKPSPLGEGKGEVSEILSLNLKTLEYLPQQKTKFATLEQTKTIDNLRDRMKVLLAGKDKAGEFYRASFYGLLRYVSERIPEIADETYRIDAAMQAGFGWELPPFECWDALGVAETVKLMEAAGYKCAAWVNEMLQKGFNSFYKVENGIKQFYDIASSSYQRIPGFESFIILNNVRANKTVWKNSGSSILDIGDGVLCCEFQTKMNTIGGEVMQGMNKAIDLAEKDFKGLVIGNDGANFSAGANLAMIDRKSVV